MICSECRHANRETAKFCENCGGRLVGGCPSCGTELRPTARFCDACGAAVASSAPTSVADVAGRLSRDLPGYTPKHLVEKILTSRSALEGERKQVTVLFADCVGFTELARAMDPEELHQIMDGCFQHVVEGVHRYEGTVNQFTGDGVMALFGAPIAHEDHAVRAVAAALTVQARLREYAATLRRERSLEFAVRIGINTGPVVVGKIGDDLRMDYTAQGETVNLAARLQQAAPTGGVLVSEATHRLVAGYFLTQEEGARPLKGFAEPVRAFSVTGQRSRRARFDLAVERGLTPLVGRARHLAFLRDCWERAVAGQGQVVSIVGEAGVGKSRLAYEFRRGLPAGGLTYVEGRPLPHGASAPFHLVVEFLQDNFGVREGEDEARRTERVEKGVRALDPALEWTIPYLKHLLALPAEELAEGGLDEVQKKRRLVEAVRAFVLRGAEVRPLLLLAEDLQWIDPNSEEFFRGLVDSLATHPILFLTTYRGGYAPPWQDRSFHQRLVVEPLTRTETTRMVEALGGRGELALRELVVERAEGNPLFIEELARYVREHGQVGDLPATVHDLLTARIDRLREPLKRTLQVAAVLGREFRLSLLEGVAREPELEPRLGELVTCELLRAKDVLPEPTFVFSHPLIQQVAYEGLLLKSRAEIHTRAGATLERLYAGRVEDVVEDLAEHYARSPERAKAVHYLALAGDRAASLFAYREAEARYTRALELCDGRADASETRAAILEKIGDVAFAHGTLATALARWDEAHGLVAARGDRRRTAELHRKMAGACWAAGRREPALAHLEDGLVVLGEDSGNMEAARLYHELGRIHFRLGQHARATEWARRALELGERLGAPDVVANAWNTVGVAVARDGDLEGGAEFVARSLETALAHQLGAVACRAYTNLAVMYTTLDHARSEQYCRAGLALAEKIGDRLQQAWLYCVLAGGHCTIAGDYDEGLRAAEAAIELDERLGQQNHLPVPLIILAQIHQCRGDSERSAHYYRRALTVAESVGEPQLLVPCYEGLATLAIERDDAPEAEAWVARSRQVQQSTGWTSDTFVALPFLC